MTGSPLARAPSISDLIYLRATQLSSPLDMGGDSLLASFEYPKGIAKVDRDAIGAMQHVSFACGPTRHREILERLKENGVTIDAGPLLVIPPAIHSFYFFDPNGIRLEISSDL